MPTIGLNTVPVSVDTPTMVPIISLLAPRLAARIGSTGLLAIW
jgi:hypothetical protein